MTRWSTKRVPDTDVLAMWKRLQEGVPLKELAKSRGTTPENISALFRSRKLSSEVSRTCLLPECGKEFTSSRPSKTCCRKHAKLLSMRTAEGRTATEMPCTLPECSKTIWMVYTSKKPDFNLKTRGGSGKRFCCKEHAELHGRRRRFRVYSRVLGDGPVCMVKGCRESLVLDKHHIEWCRKNGSDKTSKTVWLCPTHHQQVHRGYAEFRDGKFISLVPLIKRGIQDKAPLFTDYKKSLGISGYTWTESK